MPFARMLLSLVVAASMVLAQDADLLMRRAAESIRKGDLAGAEKSYSELCQMPGKARVAGIIGLAGVLNARQKYDDAVQMLRNSAAETGNLEYTTVAGVFLLQRGLRDAASKEIEPVVASARAGDKLNGSTLLTLSLVEQRLGDLEAAVDVSRRACEVLRAEGDGRWTAAGLLTASLLQDSGQATAAEVEFEYLVDAAPNDAGVLNNYAYHLAVLNKKMETALAHSKHSLEIAPGNPLMLDTLGLIYIKLGRFDDAVAALALSWRAKPENTVVRNHLAQALAKRKNPSKALQELLENLRAEPTAANTSEIYRLLDALGE